MRKSISLRPIPRKIRVAAVGSGLCTVALFASSCSQGVSSVPLPGGADVGDHPLHITVQFDNVLDLVPQSSVKVDGISVGKVDSISVGPSGWTANVKTEINNSVSLPANATAEVKQTNLLGEKFVSLEAPKENPSAQRLADGAVIPLSRTRHAVEIEEIFGALSLLLNGGGVAQLQPIVTELNKAVGGREPQVRALLEQANTLISGLEEQVDSITKSLDGLDTLSTRVSQQNDQLGKLIDELPKGVGILQEQRPQLVAMLGQLDRLGKVGYDVLNNSKQNLITDLRSLRPTLQALGKAAPDLVTSLPLVPTYPFPDSSLPALHGGSMNLFASVDLQVGDALSNLGVGKADPVYYPPPGRPVPVNPTNPYYNGNGPRPGWPTVSLLPLPPIIPNPIPQPGVPAPGAPVSDPMGSLLKQLGVGPR
ncbi:MCE family protein [Skermania sp. ID1734]|uniref:MCE family protein n=1 Tax=Skermania sp. ID1734 TaxID=2597516 RepID=UPI00117C2A33|nr:MCE family protein [Skermania sp. ID1734]TSD95088.1 MCE family protein [Skermania sp. ID1734]